MALPETEVQTLLFKDPEGTFLFFIPILSFPTGRLRYSLVTTLDVLVPIPDTSGRFLNSKVKWVKKLGTETPI